MRNERNAVADRLDRRKRQNKPSDLPVRCCNHCYFVQCTAGRQCICCEPSIVGHLLNIKLATRGTSERSRNSEVNPNQKGRQGTIYNERSSDT